MQHRDGIRRHAHPLAVLVNPRIDEAFVPDVPFAAFHSPSFESAGNDPDLTAVHEHCYGFRYDLLILRTGCRF